MAELMALRPDGTAPTALLAQIEQIAAAAAGAGQITASSDGDGTWDLESSTGNLAATSDGDGTWTIGA